MKFRTQIQRYLGSGAVLAALLVSGCVSPGRAPRNDAPIAIATEAVEPEFQVRQLDIGRGVNAGKGAGFGFLQGALLPLRGCSSGCGDGAALALLLVPFTAAAGTVVGAIAGAASKPEVDNDRFSKEGKQSVEATVVPQLAELMNSDALRDAILGSARLATQRPLVPVQTRFDGKSAQLVNVASGLPTGAFANVLIARIAKVNVVTRKMDGKQKLGLVLWADVAYVDASVPVDEYWHRKKRIRRISSYYDVEDWNDRERLRGIAKAALEDIALSITDRLL